MAVNVEGLGQLLAELGLKGEIRALAESARTAALAAAQVGCKIGAIAVGE